MASFTINLEGMGRLVKELLKRDMKYNVQTMCMMQFQ